MQREPFSCLSWPHIKVSTQASSVNDPCTDQCSEVDPVCKIFSQKISARDRTDLQPSIFSTFQLRLIFSSFWGKIFGAARFTAMRFSWLACVHLHISPSFQQFFQWLLCIRTWSASHKRQFVLAVQLTFHFILTLIKERNKVCMVSKVGIERFQWKWRCSEGWVASCRYITRYITSLHSPTNSQFYTSKTTQVQVVGAAGVCFRFEDASLDLSIVWSVNEL